jgi:hypothetical protein
MGLYCYVNFTTTCPVCNHTLKNFQSKDQDGILMKVNEPWTLNNFYDYCDNCKSNIDYTRKGSEISSINLVEEGKVAVSLLRRFKSIQVKDMHAVQLEKDIEEFLAKTNYPKDDANWLEWYTIKVDGCVWGGESD